LPRGNPKNGHAVRNVSRYNGTGSHYAALSDSNSRQNSRPNPNKGEVLNGNKTGKMSSGRDVNAVAKTAFVIDACRSIYNALVTDADGCAHRRLSENLRACTYYGIRCYKCGWVTKGWRKKPGAR